MRNHLQIGASMTTKLKVDNNDAHGYVWFYCGVDDLKMKG